MTWHVKESFELNGSASRGIYRFGNGKRAVLFSLTATNPAATPYSSGNLPGEIPSGASSSVLPVSTSPATSSAT